MAIRVPNSHGVVSKLAGVVVAASLTVGVAVSTHQPITIMAVRLAGLLAARRAADDRQGCDEVQGPAHRIVTIAGPPHASPTDS